MKYYFPLLVLLALCWQSCETDPPANSEDNISETTSITTLPFQQLPLDDLSGFQPTSDNWGIAGQANADFNQSLALDVAPGTGIIVNQPVDGQKSHLLTAWEHGDLELEIEVMMPKGSNSGIYFQGRYEIQLLDSWKVKEPQHSDIGGIYQRWDHTKPEEERGYEGHPPAKNMAKAPGLWQHFYIAFRAPRFDASGNKVENARFEKVVHNGFTIHENVELTGPTRAAMAEEEVAIGPLMIQGDHGPVAIRNILYKRYFDQEAKIQDFKYAFYSINEPLSQLPDFDTLTPTKRGDATKFDINLSPQEDEFGLRFTGQINVPIEGDYIFHTISDDGTKFYLDNQLLVSNDLNHGMKREGGLITLSAGLHPFKLDYYNNTWGKGLAVMYEGPSIKYQTLYSEAPDFGNDKENSLIINPDDTPELVRCFMNYKDEKRTHVIAVCQPEQIHYSMDLDEGTLLHFWRGDFADVSNMWVNRGHSQLLIPLNLSIESFDAPLVAHLENINQDYPVESSDMFKLDRYELNEGGYPTFYYTHNRVTIRQSLTASPDQDQLVRTIQLMDETENLFTMIGKSDHITLMENGYYNIGGEYYIKVLEASEEAIIREKNNQFELIFPITSSNPIKYSILW